MRFLPPGKPLGNFCQLGNGSWRVKMASPGLFCCSGAFFACAFWFCGCFRLVGVLPWCCAFFLRRCCFFASLWDKMVLLFSLLFCCCCFGLAVLLFLRFFYCSFVVLRVFGARGDNCLVLRVFVTLILFFLRVFSVCFTVCLLHLCRCRCGFLLCSLCRFTSFFAVVSCVYFCLDLLGLILWPVFADRDVDVHVYPSDYHLLFFPFSRSYRVRSRPTMGIRGHSCLIYGPQPSITSHSTHSHPLTPTMTIHKHPWPTTSCMLCFCAFCTVLLCGRECVCALV